MQDWEKVRRTTTDGISKTYKDCERLSPSDFVEIVRDLLVPDRGRKKSNPLNPRRIAVQLPPFLGYILDYKSDT